MTVDPAAQPPRPHVTRVLTSLGGLVEQATTVATVLVRDQALLDGVAPELRAPLRGLCDAVYDLDHRTAALEPPSGDQLRLGG